MTTIQKPTVILYKNSNIKSRTLRFGFLVTCYQNCSPRGRPAISKWWQLDGGKWHSRWHTDICTIDEKTSLKPLWYFRDM